MHSTEYSLIEVVMQRHEPGDSIWSEYLLNNYRLMGIPLEEVTKPVQEVIEAKAENEKARSSALIEGIRVWKINSVAYEADLIVTQPFTVWQFSCFGQNFLEGIASGIEHEIQQMDSGYVFEPYLEELQKIGDSLITEYKQKYEGKLLQAYMPDFKTVRFVTLWSYTGYEDSYSHEFDSEWTLLGLLDIKPVLGVDTIKESRVFGIKEL